MKLFAQNRVSGRQTTGLVSRRSWRTIYPFSLPMDRRARGIIACPCCPSHFHAVVPYLPRDIHPVHDRAIVCVAMHHRTRSGLPSCSKQSRRLRPRFHGWQKMQSLGLCGSRRGGFCRSSLWHDRDTSKHVWECAIRVVIYICGPCYQLLAILEPRAVYHSPIKLLSSQWSQMS